MEEMLGLVKQFAGFIQFIAVVFVAGLVAWSEYKVRRGKAEAAPPTPMSNAVATMTPSVTREEHGKLEQWVEAIHREVKSGNDLTIRVSQTLDHVTQTLEKVSARTEAGSLQQVRHEEQLHTLFSHHDAVKRKQEEVEGKVNKNAADIRVLEDRTLRLVKEDRPRPAGGYGYAGLDPRE